MAKKRNLFRRSRKLVTLGSLRLGLELLGRENCIEFHPILWGCKVRNPQNLAGSAPNVPDISLTFGRDLERSDKSPFDKGGFRGNVDALITRKGELFDSPFHCDSGGIGYFASCGCSA